MSNWYIQNMTLVDEKMFNCDQDEKMFNCDQDEKQSV
jgi:hypothetical protein